MYISRTIRINQARTLLSQRARKVRKDGRGQDSHTRRYENWIRWYEKGNNKAKHNTAKVDCECQVSDTESVASLTGNLPITHQTLSILSNQYTHSLRVDMCTCVHTSLVRKIT